MTKRAQPNLYTIPPGADFAAVAALAILDGGLDLPPLRDDRLALADLVIYVPSRRIAGLIEAAFASAFAPRPVILPMIRPLREPGDALERLAAGDALALAPQAAKRPLSMQERRYRLYPLVAEWLEAVHQRRAEASIVPQDRRSAAGRAAFIAEAMRLSTALGGLIDEMAIEGLPLSRLASVAPERFDPAAHDEYWWMTRDFLRLAAERWPLILESLDAEDEAVIELQRIHAEALRMEREPPAHPVIILGSTGSVRATAELMRAVSRLPKGAVVLPGLDLDLDEESWTLIGAEEAGFATRFAHPQAMLKRSLGIIGAPRDAVRILGQATGERNTFLSESFRPAEHSDRWQGERVRLDLDAALSGIRVFAARDERQEASAIALALRETLHNSEKTAALVTADRKLARRVRMELKRHGIEASDSGGQRLSETAPGVLIRLLLIAERERSGAAFLAVLRHPLMRMGENEARFAGLVDAMELLVWRGRHFTANLSQEQRVITALTDQTRREGFAARRVEEATRQALPRFAANLDHLIGGLAASTEPCNLASLAEALRDILLDATRDETGSPLILADPHWPAINELLEELCLHARDIAAPVKGLEPIVEMLLAERSMPDFAPAHPRCAILGLLEARLVHADRIIIGGLSEGSLPPSADTDPFLNRTMRLAIGLQPPERRIGQSAHDLMMLAGNADLVLTQARRIGTQPGIPSRFLRRMAAFAGKAWEETEKAGDPFLLLADRLDQPTGRTPAHAAPSVTPAILPRVPTQLSITEVETLRRDPYALYAKKLLRLEPLEPVDSEPDARERGTLFHAIIEQFTTANPPDDPDTALQMLRDIARDAFAPFAQDRERHHFWWQSFEAVMPGLVALNREAREAKKQIRLEARARHTVVLATGDEVTIGGRIDRLETDASGTSILDFKSGHPPRSKAVFSGNAPQLPITAALVRRGAVEGLGLAPVTRLGYVPISGKIPVEILELQPKEGTLEDAIEAQYRWLIDELNALARGEKPYRSRVAMQKTADASDYDHLARRLEWSLADEDDPQPEAEDEA